MLDAVLPLLAGAVLTAQADREAAVEYAARQLGQPAGQVAGELWAHVADATWSEAAATARHRIIDATQFARPLIGEVHPSRVVIRTYGQHGKPQAPWQFVADVSTHAVSVIAWNAISRWADYIGRSFDPDQPHQAWIAARNAAREALVVLQNQLDADAHAAGIRWSTP